VTCIWLDEHRRDFTNTVKLELLPRGVPFTEQAKMICHLLYGCGLSGLGIHGWELPAAGLKRGNITIETNGLGIGLYDVLATGDNPWLPGVRPMAMTYERKHRAVAQWDEELRRSPGQAGAKHGISEDITLPGGQKLIDYLRALQLEIKVSVKDGTTVVWEHSDILSAGIVCRTGRMERVLSV
jgi:hypothetical protein